MVERRGGGGEWTADESGLAKGTDANGYTRYERMQHTRDIFHPMGIPSWLPGAPTEEQKRQYILYGDTVGLTEIDKDGLSRDAKWLGAMTLLRAGWPGYLLNQKAQQGWLFDNLTGIGGRAAALAGLGTDANPMDLLKESFNPIWRPNDRRADFVAPAKKELNNVRKKKHKTKGSIARGEKTAKDAQADYFAGRYG